MTDTKTTIKMSHIVLGLGAIALLANGNDLAASMAEGSQIADKQQTFNDELRDQRMSARQLERQAAESSDLALKRVRGACVPVLDGDTQGMTNLYEGRKFVSLADQKAVGGRVEICSATGDTAIAQDGYIEAGTIARVNTEDLGEYARYFQQRQAAYQ